MQQDGDLDALHPAAVATPPAAKRLKLQLPPLPPSTAALPSSRGPSGVHAAASKHPSRFFTGVKVFLPPTGIPFGSTRAKLWRASVERNGGSLTQDPKAPGITHVVVGEGGIRTLPLLLQPGGGVPAASTCTTSQRQREQAGKPGDSTGNSAAQAGAVSNSAAGREDGALAGASGGGGAGGGARAYVSHLWLERCLAKGRLLPPGDFPPPDPTTDVATPTAGGRPGSRSSEGTRGSAASCSSTGGGTTEAERYRDWLGPDLWHPGCAGMSLTELALQAVYSEERSRKIGNEPLVQVLRELSRYERALHEDYFQDSKSGKEAVNHRALRYSRAAAVVRACAYRLQPGVQGGDLPFVGTATAQQINDILETGTCAALDCFRADAAVTDSRGRRRTDSVGGATRARFHALPGVGQKAAKRWWDLGCRTFEDVELAAQPGGLMAPDGPFPLSLEACFSLQHRTDLLEGTNPAEVQEMLEVVASGLEEASGHGGWRLELVGGGRRSAAVHDADFLATHPERSIEGVVLQLRDHLVATGRLFPPDQAMCRVQAGLLPTHLDKLREEHLHEESGAPSKENMDKFDHIYGLFRTSAGKVRRLDVILCPADEWAFGLVGWIGSRQYLRFMRQHAKDMGLYLSSHRLMRKVDGSSCIVPDEAAPVDRSGREHWPPGWSPGRRLESQADLFELMGIPYREAHERNAP